MKIQVYICTMSVIERTLEKTVKMLKKQFPIVAITGPRQAGKTTLLKNAFENYRYISLENPDNRYYAETNPNAFLKEYDQYVIFDEVQRVPSLFSYLQTLVDDSGIMGQFILSGSQNFQLMENITQSLAGRVAICRLFPFDHQELKKAKLISEHWTETAWRGCYPAIYDRKIKPTTYYANYIETYVQRDISDLLKISDMRLFKNFISLCAMRVGQVLNMNNLAKECGITQPTAKSWLSVLETSYILFMLPPYYKNYKKRIIKSPKLYFYDTGLLCNLLGIKNELGLRKYAQAGSLFENFVMAEKIKRSEHLYEKNEYWYWRDSNGNEIDLLHIDNGQLVATEIKSTETILPNLFNALNKFEGIVGDEKIKKELIYGGNKNQKRLNVSIASWTSI